MLCYTYNCTVQQDFEFVTEVFQCCIMFLGSELAPNFDQSMQQGPKYHCRSYQRAGRTQFQRMPFGAIVHWCCCPAETLKVQKITGICWRQSVWSSSWVGGEADKQARTVRAKCVRWNWKIGSKHHIPSPGRPPGRIQFKGRAGGQVVAVT